MPANHFFKQNFLIMIISLRFILFFTNFISKNN
jgi:hypothetical protein